MTLLVYSKSENVTERILSLFKTFFSMQEEDIVLENSWLEWKCFCFSLHYYNDFTCVFLMAWFQISNQD